jgi:ectoine hydroxylase-related dioxygenase (phytanoyl-CoA dioxygenase family)
VRTKRRSTGGTIEYPVHEFQRKLNIYRSHDPLMFSPAYSRFLLLPALREVAAGYLGRSWLYQAMIATRTLPSAPTKEGFARWHHDARGRKLNVIMPLTDVSLDGSATIVLAGSQRQGYSRDRRLRNVFSDEEIAVLKRKHGWVERVCEAPAGSLVFSDSQALHLGRRSPESRDAFQVNCMTKRSHLWPQEIPRSLMETLTAEKQGMLLRRSNLRVV